MAFDNKAWLNRARRLRTDDPGLEVVHTQAAGIDVGNGSHYVAVRPDRDPEPVRRFECFTADLHRLADWLRSCGVKTVAMQSTGVYWIPLYEVLEERGFKVYLVNARHTKNLPGRKSDVLESQWLLKLHTCGLLNNSFQPPAEIRILRTYWRQRADHVRGAATCVQRVQKVLTQMNIQLANVISDVSGLTGQTIVRWSCAGRRRSTAGCSHRRPNRFRARWRGKRRTRRLPLRVGESDGFLSGDFVEGTDENGPAFGKIGEFRIAAKDRFLFEREREHFFDSDIRLHVIVSGKRASIAEVEGGC